MTKKVLFACLAVLLLSCSRAEPRIPFGYIELYYVPGDTLPEERFSFFVIAEDDDGFDNITELRLYHDREGLEWILSSDDWITHEEDDKYWIGSRSIAMPEGQSLPRGQFRAVLFNSGGERTERLITFDAPEYPRYPNPSFRIENGNYSINSQYPENSFIVYDLEGNIIEILPLSLKEGSLADFGITGTLIMYALWAQDEVARTSFLTEALPLR